MTTPFPLPFLLSPGSGAGDNRSQSSEKTEDSQESGDRVLGLYAEGVGYQSPGSRSAPGHIHAVARYIAPTNTALISSPIIPRNNANAIGIAASSNPSTQCQPFPIDRRNTMNPKAPATIRSAMSTMLTHVSR